MWRSVWFGFDDEQSKVYIAELKWLVALSSDAVPSEVLKAKESRSGWTYFSRCGSAFGTTRRSQTLVAESTFKHLDDLDAGGLSAHRLEDRLRYMMNVVLPMMEERRTAHKWLMRRRSCA